MFLLWVMYGLVDQQYNSTEMLQWKVYHELLFSIQKAIVFTEYVFPYTACTVLSQVVAQVFTLEVTYFILEISGLASILWWIEARCEEQLLFTTWPLPINAASYARLQPWTTMILKCVINHCPDSIPSDAITTIICYYKLYNGVTNQLIHRTALT